MESLATRVSKAEIFESQQTFLTFPQSVVIGKEADCIVDADDVGGKVESQMRTSRSTPSPPRMPSLPE